MFEEEDDNEEMLVDENFKRVTEICEEVIKQAHEKVFLQDKKSQMSIKELKDIMFVVREAHYIIADPGELLINGISGAIRTVDEDNEEEDENEDDDSDEFEED